MKDELVKPHISKQRRKNGIKQRTLGCVPDLEEHVPSDWWRQIFNSVYLKTDGDVVEDHYITNHEIDLFTEILNLTPSSKILDLCCGQGRHTIEFCRRGFENIEGLDRSHYLIQRAKTHAKKEGLTVKFREGDARKIFTPADSFDVVLIVGNSFGYFDTLKDDLQVLKEVSRVLKPGGKILMDITDGEYLRENYQPRSWEWINKNLFVCRERSLSKDNQRLISREVVTHVKKGVIVDQFYAERLYSNESLAQLFNNAGFSDITFHDQISADSKRNQDLGMMGRRLIIVATVKKEHTVIKQKPKESTKNIAVLLGDPTMPDPVKPHSVFDDDDFYTIDQLKSNLNLHKEYTFTYLNNHTTLNQDLMKLKGNIDLILNLADEGYKNESQNELLIPALLDIHQIPYTGSGPHTLASCYDKSLIRGIAREMGIPVPKSFFIKPEDFTFELPFPFPVIVKPNYGDGGFGITSASVANNIEELTRAIYDIRDKFGYEKPLIIEEFLPGKDLSLGILGNPPDFYTVLPIVEEDYSALPSDLPKICGYEAKWLEKSQYWKIITIRAELAEEIEKAIIEWSLQLFMRLQCRDYARLDWRLDAEGTPRLLEINPNPGWCWDGHLSKMAALNNINYSQLLKEILTSAEKRLKLFENM